METIGVMSHEELATIDNLPGSQLSAEAELRLVDSEDDFDEEDNLPVSILKSKIQKRDRPNAVRTEKRLYVWNHRDIDKSKLEFPVIPSAYNNRSPIELFSLFLNNKVIDMFVHFSNKYTSSKNKIGNITQTEMKNFFRILLLSGYVQVSRRRLYWENRRDSHNKLVVNTISRDRFEYIMSNIHCCDNDNLDPTDRFTKVRPLINKMNELFQEFAPLFENHSMDEAMIPYYGKHGYKQFIRGKVICYGFRFWKGTTSNGYVILIEPYQAAKSDIKTVYRQFRLGPSVIFQYVEILRGIANLPYHSFSDNLFTTISLLEELKKNLTYWHD
ncbi:hypothetical protein ILUMI_11602 [Ignelater luminosus]|uniref:PiggyBac transposable element-derived protein domain-containing protein n=1 Tax=Ignelater luminosus TaxID=2038154 RepID=A0A8K0D069_IGNLU|nr:hypothetical protein ILUMI_11602 [Ignelater luminosus]